MRRKDREMSREFGLKVIDKASYAVMSLVDENNKPYGLPISPARVEDIIYIHSAKEGRKLEILEKNPEVTLTFVGEVKVPDPINEDEFIQAKGNNQLAAFTSKHFTTQYESAIVIGIARILEEEEEKKEGLRAISQKYTPKNMKYFEDAFNAGIGRTMVIRIDIKEITAKRKKYSNNGEEMKWGRMEE